MWKTKEKQINQSKSVARVQNKREQKKKKTLTRYIEARHTMLTELW